MLASPAKRRKTSPTTAVPISIDASEKLLTPNVSQSQSVPEGALDAPAGQSTPSRSQTRASFQSPTKASLARYNPKLIRETAERPITRSQPRPQLSGTDSARRLTRSAGRDGLRASGSLIHQVLGERRKSGNQGTLADSDFTDAPDTPPATQEDDTKPRAKTNVRPRQESFSAAVTRTFDTVPPRPPSPRRQPLRPRQASGPLPTPGNSQDIQNHTENPKSSDSGALLNKKGDIKPTDFDDIFGLFSRADPQGESPGTEPELPPTPIQLGISAPPGQPRGLESLSSGSRRRRFRDATTKTTSPLKQRTDGEQVEPSSPLKHRSRALLEGQWTGPEDPSERGQRKTDSDSIGAHASARSTENEVTASGFERPVVDEEADSTPDPESIEQRETLSATRKQLERLKSEVARLETLVDDPQNQPEDDLTDDTRPPLDPTLLALLTTANPSCDPEYDFSNSTPPKPLREEILDVFKSSISIPAGVDPLPYLTAFAPGNLQLSTHTRTIMQDQRVHQTHTLDLSAPKPFPAHVFGATVEVLVDAEEEAVRSIAVKRLGRGVPKMVVAVSQKSKNGKPKRKTAGFDQTLDRAWQKTQLGKWIVRRLEPGSLHALDVGGLIWGIGRWWDAAVGRARLWARVRRMLSSKAATADENDEDDEEKEVDAEKKFTLSELLPHVHREGMVIRIPAAANRDRQPSSIQLHLAYTLSLDWTGEVSRHVDVSVAGVDGKTERGAKEVFAMLMRRRKIGRDGLLFDDDSDVGGGDGNWRTAWDAVEGCLGLLRSEE